MDPARSAAYALSIENRLRRDRVAPTATSARSTTCERGASLVGLLVVLLILGGIAAVTVASLPSSTPKLPGVSTTSTTARTASTGNTTTTTSPSIPTAALRTECVANVQAVLSAAQDYQALNSTSPAAGRAWATARVKGGPFLQAWPVDSEYAIAWNGRTTVVTPAHGRAAVGSTGTASPPTGCDAL
jgi:hypothetical protein